MKKTVKKSREKLVNKSETRMSFPLIEIRQRDNTDKSLMTGRNTLLLIDGKPVKGAQSVSFNVNAHGIAKATITLVGRFKVSGKIKTKKINLYK